MGSNSEGLSDSIVTDRNLQDSPHNQDRETDSESERDSSGNPWYQKGCTFELSLTRHKGKVSSHEPKTIRNNGCRIAHVKNSSAMRQPSFRAALPLNGPRNFQTPLNDHSLQTHHPNLQHRAWAYPTWAWGLDLPRISTLRENGFTCARRNTPSGVNLTVNPL